jgi:hypothetical protein
MLGAAQQTRDPRLARRAAEMALAARQPEDTLAAVRQWRQLDPQSDEATQYYLGMVILSDNISDAEEIFRKRLEGAPAGVRGIVLYQVQQLLSRAKDKEAAAAMLERIVAPYRDTLEGHVVLAQGALARGQRHFGGAARQARVARLLRQAQDRQVGPLPVAGAKRELGAQQLIQQGARQFDLRQARLFRLKLGFRVALGLGLRLKLCFRLLLWRQLRRLRNRRLLRRHGTRSQQAGEGYNDESVFQGKSMCGMMFDSTPKPRRACEGATRIYKNFVRFSCLNSPK